MGIKLASENPSLSPGQLVCRRFFRNKLAIAGLVILGLLLLFSLVGPFLSLHGEYQLFYCDAQGNEITEPGFSPSQEGGEGVSLFHKQPPSPPALAGHQQGWH